MSQQSRNVDDITRCGTCRHWTENTGWSDSVAYPDWGYPREKDTPRALALAQHNRESGLCGAINAGWTWDGQSPMPLATCWDGSEYMASLHTHKTFGCVLWEPHNAMITGVFVEDDEKDNR